MTTINVNSSCDVLWVSRQDNVSIDALFASEIEAVDSVPGVFQTLVEYGALWLAERSGFVTTNIPPSGNYLYPEGAGYSDVIQCQWSKNLTTPAGVFSMLVKPRVPWDRFIKPGDIFVIFMDDDHKYGVDTRSDGTLITIGLVDRVAKTTSVNSNGATVEVVSINGRDLGALFQDTQTIFDPTLTISGQNVENQLWNAKYMTQTSHEHVKALSPVETIYRILDLIYNQNATGSKIVGAQWALGSVPQDASGRPVSLLSLLNVVDFTQRPMPGYALVQPLGVMQAGNVWTLMESYANKAINEFFVDIRDIDAANVASIQFQGSQVSPKVVQKDQDNQNALAQYIIDTKVFNQSAFQSIDNSADLDQPVPVPALVLRQMPYDRDAFMNLPFVDIDHTEVFGFEVGSASHDAANYFEVHFPDYPTVMQELLWGIKINMQSISRFGIRRMESESRYPFTSSELSTKFHKTGSADFSQGFEFYVGLMSTWYATNETLLSGSMDCRYKPQIRIGTRIRYHAVDDSYFHFYVQGVNHVFSVQPGASRTSLTLVRGIRDGASDLANNLIWDPSKGGDGEQIPDELLKYLRVKRFGTNSQKETR